MSTLPEKQYEIQERADGFWQVVRLADGKVVCRSDQAMCREWLTDRGLHKVARTVPAAAAPAPKR